MINAAAKTAACAKTDHPSNTVADDASIEMVIMPSASLADNFDLFTVKPPLFIFENKRSTSIYWLKLFTTTVL